MAKVNGVKTNKRRGKNAKKALLQSRGGQNPLSEYRMFALPGSGLPATKRVTLKYAELFTVTSTLGAVGKYLFAANGLYDPNITSTGHQPYGFDQWMALYTKATVVRSRIDVEMNSSFTAVVNGVVFARGDPTVVTGTATCVGLVEMDRGTTVLAPSPGAPPRHIQSTFDLSVTDPDHDPGDFWSTNAANPTFTYVYCVFAQSADLASTSSLYSIATIEYDVIFQDPVTVGVS